MANGDKVYARDDYTTTSKDGAKTGEGKWTFNSGTGKFKDLKGKGTQKCKYGADGTSTCELEGEYELPK
jgi:hypothetical protein